MAVVNTVQSPFAVHNLHGPDANLGRRHATIRMFLDKAEGGLGAFNELSSKDHVYIKSEAAHRGLNVKIVGLNGIVWDPKVHHVSGPRVKKIMQGGHVGADGVHTPRPGDDDRRVGPSRYGLYFDIYTIAVDLDWELDVTHTMARSFSVHKWRQKLFWRSIDSLADGVVSAVGLMTGDFNANPPINLPGVVDINVPAPADFGRQHYTKIIRWGKQIYVGQVKEQNTPSDHDLLWTKLTLYRHPQDRPQIAPEPDVPAPVSNLPKPGSNVRWRKYGAPVAHPWKDRSARWKRRHKKLWNRIQKWQTAYRRRL